MPFVIHRKSTGTYFTDAAQYHSRHGEEDKRWSEDINNARVYKTFKGAKNSRGMPTLTYTEWQELHKKYPWWGRNQKPDMKMKQAMDEEIEARLELKQQDWEILNVELRTQVVISGK